MIAAATVMIVRIATIFVSSVPFRPVPHSRTLPTNGCREDDPKN
jgi:hypothetical protein